MFEFLSQRLSGVFRAVLPETRFTKKSIDLVSGNIKDALLESDVPLDIADAFCAEIAQKAIGQAVHKRLSAEQQFIKIAHDHLKSFLGSGEYSVSPQSFSSTVLLTGLQGAGKTTTIAKLAWYIRGSKKAKRIKILAGSTDHTRPAAIEQLRRLCEEVHIDFFMTEGSDPVDSARQLVQERQRGGYDLLLLDTAGRLHVSNDLMVQLKQIKEVALPRVTILVLDAMTGQESLSVAKTFKEQVGFDFAVLSKMDSKASGGSAFSFYYALRKPVAFVGTGETKKDLQLFDPSRVAGQILGMGDVVTLAERAEKEATQEERNSLYQSFKIGKMTYTAFASQMDMMGRLGSFTGIMRYLPGNVLAGITPEQLERESKNMKFFRAIINSMTKKECDCLVKLDKSRINRVARGAGVSVQDVKSLMQRFKETEQSVKMLSRFIK